MSKTKYRQSPLSAIKGYLLPIILFVVIFAMFLWGIGTAERSSKSEGKQVLEDSIRRAVVSCYATEGSYPQDLKYLEDNYGIRIDKDRYKVEYHVFASNVMPEITVLEVKEAETSENSGEVPQQ